MARLKVGDKYGNQREPLLSPLRRVVKEKDEADKAVDFVMPFAKDAPRETVVAPGSKEETQLQKEVDTEQTVANAQKETPSEKAEEKMEAPEEEKDDDEFMDDASYENEDVPDLDRVTNRLKGNEKPREMKPEDRGKLEKGFGQALAYFGPRLFAQLAGGNDAAAATDRIMKGFEGFQSGQRKLGQTDRELDIKEEAAKKVPAEAQGKSLEQEKFEYKKAQDTMKRQEEMAKLDQETRVKQFEVKQQMDKYDQALKGLMTKEGKIKGGVTGLFDATLGAGWDKITGGKDRRTRLLLTELQVDSGVARTAKLAGQISDKEFKALVKDPAPSEYDSEETWVRWIQDQKAITSKINPGAENYLRNVGGESSSSKSSSLLNKYGLK
jgi:hypothetical protein